MEGRFNHKELLQQTVSFPLTLTATPITDFYLGTVNSFLVGTEDMTADFKNVSVYTNGKTTFDTYKALNGATYDGANSTKSITVIAIALMQTFNFY